VLLFKDIVVTYDGYCDRIKNNLPIFALAFWAGRYNILLRKIQFSHLIPPSKKITRKEKKEKKKR
jgi:hypothetical protein